MHNKCAWIILKPTISVPITPGPWKNSSTKLVLGAQKLGDLWSRWQTWMQAYFMKRLSPYFSKFNVCTNHLVNLWKCRFWYCSFWGCLKFCISSKLLGDVRAILCGLHSATCAPLPGGLHPVLHLASLLGHCHPWAPSLSRQVSVMWSGWPPAPLRRDSSAGVRAARRLRNPRSR